MWKIFQNIYLFVKLNVKCIFCRFFPFWEFFIKIYISVCTHKYTLAHEDPPIHACFIKYKNIANYASISIKMFNVFIIVHSFINMHECVCVCLSSLLQYLVFATHTHIYIHVTICWVISTKPPQISYIAESSCVFACIR